ncbi:putative membrane protein [Chryseobacterium defluvii]|uniref:Putative membrane protein n=1 Tax=Chryseobacterium defluvii TaxID=160396 RepID=A0A840KEI6_9FLAO|nr:hypothetical protein [Chryseobacterium defluvii]MBB4806408.1 putative membrane protein [Chryseobacterium defluvii]
MKFNYIYIVLLGILFLAPVFIKGDQAYLIFQIIYFITLAVFAFLAWRGNKKNDLVLYIFLLILGVIQAFDKEDKYFFVQMGLLVVLLIYAMLEWRKKDNESIE